MFHSARWKAHQHKKEDDEDEKLNSAIIRNIYQIYYSQKLWFISEGKSEHQKAAEEHLKRSDALINDCTRRVNALEETLANTPKPSEMLAWNTITLQDLV